MMPTRIMHLQPSTDIREPYSGMRRRRRIGLQPPRILNFGYQRRVLECDANANLQQGAPITVVHGVFHQGLKKEVCNRPISGSWVDQD